MTTGGDAAIALLREEVERLRAINAELLAALERLVIDYGGVPDPTDRDGQAVFNDARAAIAKAKETT